MNDRAGAAPNRWHIRAIRLPDGRAAEDWWVAEGRLHDRPVEGAADLPGGWLLPGGLVDAHTHLTLDLAQTRLAPGSPALVAANLARHRAAGVLAVRDAGALPGVPLDAPAADSPRVLYCGRFLAPAGRYHAGMYEPAEAAGLIDAALAELARGAAWVKIVADFPGADWNWFAARATYPAAAVRALCDAVHDAGGRVAAHVSGSLVGELVGAGVDSIEHGPLVDAALLEEMAARGTAWTPTLTTVVGAIEPLARGAGPAAAGVRAALARLRETIPLAAQLGVPVLAGTDEAPAGAVALEIARLREFGLSPAAALAAASTVPRRYFGLPGFAAGAPADLVLYAADPRDEPAALREPAAVLIGGRRVG